MSRKRPRRSLQALKEEAGNVSDTIDDEAMLRTSRVSTIIFGPTGWKSTLDAYLPSEQTALAFESKDEAHKAISLLWTQPLHDCPHIFTPDGEIIVPSDAVPYFRRANLKFDEYQVES